MHPTAEVRWFRAGPIPEAVLTWFKRHEPPPQAETARVDQYLKPSGGGGLNVKLREGHLEIKRRLVAGRQVQFTSDAAGLVERWRKWSFACGERVGPQPDRAPTTSDWVAVEKVRLLKTYRLRAGDAGFADTAADGCEMELTRVVARGQTWWTLALEAFGDEAALLDHLFLVGKRALAPPCPVPLRARDSQGYAAWLAGLVHEERDP